MSDLAYKGVLSKGQDGGPATTLTHKIQCVKSYVGGNLIATVGDQFELHVANRSLHQDGQRQITAGASKTYFEGNPAARQDDPIADGDAIASGNAKTHVE